jgi:peptide/nickel transport system substrate-binding protein
MIFRAFKLRFRRRLRMQKLQVEELGQQAERQLERNFFRRLERLADVRRFVATWIILLVLLSGVVVAQIQGLGAYYKAPSPVAGGTYSEGILGSFSNANPLYATSPVDISVSRLLFASLLTYNEKNELVGDLAQGWNVDARGTTYTVQLKPNLKWQDGKPLTAADVVFTYQVIQNPDARSPLASSWRGIIVKETDPRTVTFTLPNQLVAFPYSLTNGIVPRHILGVYSMSDLRTVRFNTTEPVGAGPFRFGALEVTGGSAETREQRIALEPFDAYYAGKPKLNRFVIYSFRNQQRLLESFKAQEINAMVGLTRVPQQFKEDGTIRIYNMPLTAEVLVFFRVGEGVLSDANVRQALVRATNINEIIDDLQFPTFPVRSPLLRNQIGYSPNYLQAGYDLASAEALLTQQGWQKGKDGIRHKAGVPLSFTISTQDNSEYAMVARLLQKQWRAVGVDLKVDLENSADFQGTLANHNYEALLHGISIGNDPDVNVYWNSRNADARAENRLNFSEYKSPIADEALQSGRTRSDPALRAVKYQPFLQAWQTDAPAVGLYQPRFLYITRGPVHGLNEHTLNSGVQRFANVQNWMIREAGIAQSKQ